MELSIVNKDKRNNYKQEDFNMLQRERELISKIKLGVFEDSWDDLEKIIENIVKADEPDIFAIKIKVMELMFVLSRAIVDAGADYEKISKINYRLAMDITELEEIEKIPVVAKGVLKSYVETKPVRGLKGYKLAKQVKQFILNNYSKQLTLETIAKAVYISPFYLSHLFKEVEGLSVIDFLTKVRIEKAKVLLRDSNYSINEVSIRLGYNDSSYFTKVFRRKEGRTPSQFRKLG